MGRFHRLAEPPRQPTQNQGADGARLPSARRCRRSARIPRRPARRLKKIPPIASNRAAHVRRAPPPETRGENMTEQLEKGQRLRKMSVDASLWCPQEPPG